MGAVGDVAQAVAAVGTLAAAGFAGWAAKSASDAAATADEAVAAEFRPILIDVPYERYTDYEHEYPHRTQTHHSAWRGEIRIDAEWGHCTVPIRNVGRGLARVTTVQLSLTTQDIAYSEQSTLLIPPGEDAFIRVEPEASSALAVALRRVPSPLHDPMPLVLTVNYMDAAKSAEERVELGLGAPSGGGWRVLRVEHRR